MFKRKFQPIARRKLSFFLVPSLIISLIFILYQIRMFYLLSKSVSASEKLNLPRGVHPQNAEFYRLSHDGKFTCLRSMETLDWNKVNDDYCDCLDGSDEPGTNACPNGLFHCANFRIPFVKSIPANRVNDGICDCCDGGDEWNSNTVLGKFSNVQERKTNVFHVPCSNRC